MSNSPRLSPSPAMKPDVDHEQQHNAAEIACAQPNPDTRPDVSRGGELPQHRVVRDAGQVAAGRGAGEQHETGPKVAVVVADQAHRGRQQHRQPGQHRQRPASAMRRVDPDPGDRGQHGDRDTGDEQRPAEPARGAGVAGQIVADGAGQVDGEHEGHDDRVEPRRAAVPERPRQHPRPPRGLRGRPRIAHGRPRYSPPHASTRSQRGRPCRRHRRLAEHRRSAGHRACRARSPPDRHRPPRGCADRVGEPAHRAVRRDRRGAPGRSRRSAPSAPSCADELAARNISILCANAGTATFGPVAKLDPADERAQVQLNVLGVHDLALAVLPGMVERGAGGILISGSAAGNSPIPNNATYAATKAFVNTFSESLRGELKSAGVHVTLLAPGPVRTTLPDADEAVARREAGPRLPLDLHRTHRQAVAGWLGAQQDARRARVSRRRRCRWPAGTRRGPSWRRSSARSTRDSAAASLFAPRLHHGRSSRDHSPDAELGEPSGDGGRCRRCCG